MRHCWTSLAADLERGHGIVWLYQQRYRCVCFYLFIVPLSDLTVRFQRGGCMPTLKLARTAVFSRGSGGERPQRQAETRTTEECVPCSSCCRNKQHLCATSDTTSERLVPDRRACATGGHPGGVGARSRRGRRCPPGCCAFGSASPLPTSTPVPGERPQARVSELLRTRLCPQTKTCSRTRR